MQSHETKESSEQLVHAVKYKAQVVYDAAGFGFIKNCLFIPSFQLNVGDDGYVSSREEPLLTLDAVKALDLSVELFACPLDDLDIKTIVTTANKNAFISVTLPLDIVKVIANLYAKIQDADTTQIQAQEYKKKREEIVKTLF